MSKNGKWGLPTGDGGPTSVNSNKTKAENGSPLFNFWPTKKSADLSGSWESQNNPIVLGLSPTSSIANQETLSSPCTGSYDMIHPALEKYERKV